MRNQAASPRVDSELTSVSDILGFQLYATLYAPAADESANARCLPQGRLPLVLAP